jgi:hypothetical protein
MAISPAQLMSPAAVDLGLGDQLRQQSQEEIDARKKKKLQMESMSPGGGAAASQLFSAVGSYSV